LIIRRASKSCRVYRYCKVEAIKLRKMRLGALDETGRPRPEPIPESDFIVKFDTVILVIGELATSPYISDYKDIKVTNDGRIQVDDRYRTTREGVFVASDVITGLSRMGLAMRSGIEAANAIGDYLNSRLSDLNTKTFVRE